MTLGHVRRGRDLLRRWPLQLGHRRRVLWGMHRTNLRLLWQRLRSYLPTMSMNTHTACRDRADLSSERQAAASKAASHRRAILQVETQDVITRSWNCSRSRCEVCPSGRRRCERSRPPRLRTALSTSGSGAIAEHAIAPWQCPCSPRGRGRPGNAEHRADRGVALHPHRASEVERPCLEDAVGLAAPRNSPSTTRSWRYPWSRPPFVRAQTPNSLLDCTTPWSTSGIAWAFLVARSGQVRAHARPPPRRR